MNYVFDKGLDQKKDPDKATGLLEATDISYEKIGSIRSVKENLISAIYRDAVHSLMFGGLSSGDPMLVAIADSIYFGVSALKSGFSGRKWEYTSQGGALYFTNLSDGLWYFKGSQIYREGAPAPSVGSFAAAAGGGTGFTGTYNLKVTFVNENGEEGNESTLISTPLLANNNITVSGIPTNSNPDYNITSRRIYIFGGTTPNYVDYQLGAEIEDNTTTTATIATTDVESITLDIDNLTPPVGDFVFSHYNVLFSGSGNSLQFSKTGHPGQWPAEQAFTISRSGDPMMMGLSWNGLGYIVTRKGITQIVGSPGTGSLFTNFYQKETRATEGTIAKRSVTPTPYGLFYQAEAGIRKFDGDTSVIFSNEVEDELAGRNTQDIPESLSVGSYINNQFILSFCYGTSQIPNRSVIYDFNRNQWSVSAKGYNCMAPDRANNILYVGSQSNLEVWREGINYAAWSAKTPDFQTEAGKYSVWGLFETDMIGTITAEIYSDGELSQMHSLVRLTRGLTERRRFPDGLIQRHAIRYSGAYKSSQDVIYGVNLDAKKGEE